MSTRRRFKPLWLKVIGVLSKKDCTMQELMDATHAARASIRRVLVLLIEGNLVFEHDERRKGLRGVTVKLYGWRPRKDMLEHLEHGVLLRSEDTMP